MPTVHRENGFRFFFYTNEGNEPAHIHIVGKGGEMKIWLNPIEVSKSYRLSPKDQKAILKITQKNLRVFLDNWENFHG